MRSGNPTRPKPNPDLRSTAAWCNLKRGSAARFGRREELVWLNNRHLPRWYVRGGCQNSSQRFQRERDSRGPFSRQAVARRWCLVDSYQNMNLLTPPRLLEFESRRTVTYTIWDYYHALG